MEKRIYEILFPLALSGLIFIFCYTNQIKEKYLLNPLNTNPSILMFAFLFGCISEILLARMFKYDNKEEDIKDSKEVKEINELSQH